jgi:hypothetical protein
MAFNVSNFRSDGLKYGGARPSLFKILVSPPAGIGIGSSTTKQLSLLARSAQLPAVTIDTVEAPYFGRKIKLQGDRTWADWTITVMNDEDFALRSVFESWSNEMNTFVSNRNSFGDSALAYKVDGIVQQYGKAGPKDEGGVIRSYKMVGIFPTTIGAINLDWDATNQIEVYDVTFSVDWVEPVEFGGGEIYTPTLPEDGSSSTAAISGL